MCDYKRAKKEICVCPKKQYSSTQIHLEFYQRVRHIDTCRNKQGVYKCQSSMRP